MFPRTSAADNLQRLLLLRSVMIAIEGVVLWFAVGRLQIDIAWHWMLAILLMLSFITAYTWLRARRGSRATDTEFFGQLIVDVVALTALLYLSGGSANPFVSLYLLPLVIAATMLPAGYAWATAAATGLCYALLFFFYVPLPAFDRAHEHRGFELHLFGMWLNFLISAVIICWFVVRMAEAIRKRDAQLAKQREEAMRNERIVALGTLAAGAAHELGTPLSTMAVLLGEMAQDHPQSPALMQDIGTLRTQVDACKQTITRMVAAAGQARAEGGNAQSIDVFLQETLEAWRLIRPAVTIAEQVQGAAPAPFIVTEQTLRQAIISLLNNAADASPQAVEVECEWDSESLRMEIRDRGPGVSREVRERAGYDFFSTKPAGQGNGIGLLLARATIERLGGHVDLAAREGGGATTSIQLPLAGLNPHRASAVATSVRA